MTYAMPDDVVEEPQGYSTQMGFVKSQPENNEVYVNRWRNDAWFYAIKRCADEIEKIVPGYNISQIKEKFGGLRFYISFPEDVTDEQRKKAEEWVSWAENFVEGMNHARRFEAGQVNNEDYIKEPWWKR